MALQTLPHCQTCSELADLHENAFTALRSAQAAYRTALRASDVASFGDLEEELKQSTAACRFIGDARRKHSERSHVTVVDLLCA